MAHRIGEECTGCGICIEVCPAKAVKESDLMVLFIAADLCTDCGKCADSCPLNAITAQRGIVKAGGVEHIRKMPSDNNPGKSDQARCPKCGFSYSFDGRSCGHCGFNLEGDPARGNKPQAPHVAKPPYIELYDPEDSSWNPVECRELIIVSVNPLENISDLVGELIETQIDELVPNFSKIGGYKKTFEHANNEPQARRILLLKATGRKVSAVALFKTRRTTRVKQPSG
jgi:ferredoxin